MTHTTEDILKLVLQLSPEDRLMIAQELWNSLDPDHDSPVVIDDALLAEIDRRDAEMRSGAVSPLTHEELMASARKAIECRQAITHSSTKR